MAIHSYEYRQLLFLIHKDILVYAAHFWVGTTSFIFEKKGGSDKCMAILLSFLKLAF